MRDKWIWRELPECALAYYLPPNAVVPTEYKCRTLIFGSLFEKCAVDSRYNAGSINVAELPDFSGDGRAIVQYEQRFLMAPERLTF